MPRYGNNKTLREFISAADDKVLPEILLSSRTRVADDYGNFLKIIESGRHVSIYGYNRLPGHRDSEHFPESYFHEFQGRLVENHAIQIAASQASVPFGFLTLAKLYSIAAGGSLISPELFSCLCEQFQEGDFNPRIALGNSYSAGDVIPAAIWARTLLVRRGTYKPKPGEGMALINGAFVHLGASAWAIKRLDEVFGKFLLGTRFFFRHVRSDDGFFEFPHTAERQLTSSAIRFVSEYGFPPEPDKPQAPVSVRATPQILDGLISALNDFCFELNYYLFKPSGNPQLRRGPDGEFHIVPSGSFLIPSLALAGSKLIDAILMLLFYLQRRLEYFLSGNVVGIPRDGASKSDPLGLIQWPKLIAAKIERARLSYSRRAFGSVAVTSYGVEDFSTNGTLLTEDIFALTDLLAEIVDLDYTAMQSASLGKPPDLKKSKRNLAREVISLTPELSLTR